MLEPSEAGKQATLLAAVPPLSFSTICPARDLMHKYFVSLAHMARLYIHSYEQHPLSKPQAKGY
jgi:hypothetical protein